jgi:hypothetical protein
VDQRLKDRDMGLELLPAARTLLSERGYDPVLGARPLRRTIQRQIEDNLSEKILFGELRAGQIITVDVEGAGPQAQFTFEGVPKPGEVPGAPPAEIDSKTAAGGTGGAPGQRRVTPPGQRLSSPSRGVLRSLTRLRRGPPATGTRPWQGLARRSAGAGNPAMACDLELPLPRRSCRRPGRPGVRFRR